MRSETENLYPTVHDSAVATFRNEIRWDPTTRMKSSVSIERRLFVPLLVSSAAAARSELMHSGLMHSLGLTVTKIIISTIGK